MRCPGAVKVDAAPPPGPVTPCRSMLCGILLSRDGSCRWNSTVSPWRTRMKLPGHRAAEGPEGVVDAFGRSASDLAHFELDDDLRRRVAVRSAAEPSAAWSARP